MLSKQRDGIKSEAFRAAARAAVPVHTVGALYKLCAVQSVTCHQASGAVRRAAIPIVMPIASL